MKITKETEEDIDSINRLGLELFGKSFPNLRRAANLLREGKSPEKGFSFVVKSEEEILQASVRCYGVCIEFEERIERRGLLLGPLMVRPEVRGLGYGVGLVEKVITESETRDLPLITVGDAGYFVPKGFNVMSLDIVEINGEVAPLSVMIYRLGPKFCAIRKI